MELENARALIWSFLTLEKAREQFICSYLQIFGLF